MCSPGAGTRSTPGSSSECLSRPDPQAGFMATLVQLAGAEAAVRESIAGHGRQGVGTERDRVGADATDASVEHDGGDGRLDAA